MCNRYRMAKDSFTIIVHGREFQIAFGARYNITPTQKVPILIPDPVEDFKFVEMTWGLQVPWQSGPVLNAKAETLTQRNTFKSIIQNRCLIPADGFYEFTGPEGNKQPILFTKKHDAAFCIAGLYQTIITQPEDVEIKTQNFVLITTTPNKSVGKYHDRMPLIVHEQHYGWWLTGSELYNTALENPDKEELYTLPVTKELNKTKNNEGPHLNRPAPIQRELL